MKNIDGEWVVSATDLSTFYTCEFKFELARQVIEGKRTRPEASALLDIIRKHGLDHEKRVLDTFIEKHHVIQLNPESRGRIADMQADCAQTLQAMRTGADYIYQAALFTGDFYGIVDFLVLRRNEDGTPAINQVSGQYVYEPLDAKSARSEKVSAIIQVASYARALRELGAPIPPSVHLHLGNDRQWSGATLQLLPVVDQMMLNVFASLNVDDRPASKQWGEKKTACEQCDWKKDCEDGRRADRDLSIVQGLRSDARMKLRAAGMDTIEALASADDSEKPQGQVRATFENLRLQAGIQIRTESSTDPIPEHELRDSAALASFPQSSPGDIFFDIEGDPFANSGQGLEYLLGVVIVGERGADEFKCWWADNPVEERECFEQFVDWVNQRIEVYPDLHVYHYADYERAALLRLALRHDTRVEQVDSWLRTGRLIDHYGIVRRGLRVGTESLSIKKVEALYGEHHDEQGVATALDSVIQFEAYLGELARGESGEAAKLREDILTYNEKDCVSLRKLDTWLRKCVASNGLQLAGPVLESLQSEVQSDDPVVARLKKHFPEDPAQRTPEQQWIALMAATPGFHRREDKPTWWKIYDLAGKDLEDWEGVENAYTVVSAQAFSWIAPTGRVQNTKRTIRLKLEPESAYRDLKPDDTVKAVYDANHPSRSEVVGANRSFKSSKVLAVTPEFVEIEESVGKTFEPWTELPIGLIHENTFNSKKITETLVNLATGVADHLDGEAPPFAATAWADLLTGGHLRQPFVLHVGDEFADQAMNALLDHEEGCFAVQGPPGTGKTWNGSKIVARLISEYGWRVGICSQSHKTIEKFMDEVAKVDSNLPIVKATPTRTENPKTYHHTNPDVWMSAQEKGFLVGGTVFALNNDKHSRASDLDLMIIDEAGQFSLANALAVACHARRVLLLGDPQQLPQVSQGIHPAPISESALVHWVGDYAVMPEHLGYFLDKSHRMHSKVCKVVSDLQYEGQLQSHIKTDKRTLDGLEPGLHVVSVGHVGNRTSSAEEAERIGELTNSFIGLPWTNPDKPTRPISDKDILIVAPFNAQRRLIQETLTSLGLGAIQVGTVDKFQGQEAPIVIVSMTASSGDELPRGLDFLLSPNRLNVAISRAQWAAFVVYSPALEWIHPTTPSGVAAFGGFLGVLRSSQTTAS